MVSKINRIIFYKLLILLLIMYNHQLYSESVDSLRIDNLTVKVAIERAKTNNPYLNKLQNEIKSLESYKTSIYSPDKINFSYLNEGIGNDNVAESRVTLSQDFNFPLKTYYQVASINSKIEYLKFKYEEEVLKVRESIKIVYTNLSYTQEVLKIKKQQNLIADSLQFAVSMRLDAGFATELDRLKAKIYFDNSNNEIREAEVNLHTARYALFNLIGLDPDLQSYSIKFPDSISFFETKINQKEVLSKMKNYPGYLADEELIKSSNHEYNAVVADYLPDLSLSIYNQSFKVGDPAYGYEIGLKLPIWFFLDQSSKAESKNYEIEMAKNNIYERYLNLKKEVEYAWHSYDISRSKIMNFTASISQDSKQLLDLTFEAYRAGTVDLINLLDAQRIYLDNQIKYFTELKEYYINIITLEKFTNEEIIFN